MRPLLTAMDIQIETSYPTPLSNSSLLIWLLMSLTRQKHSPKTTSLIRDEYDYIIVGGGASGSVVASRLSEKSCVTILLLEAGPKPPLLTELPFLSRYLHGTDVDWRFKTVPQKYAASGLKNKQVPWTTGKMLGGSASFNSLVYIRGNKKDYDYWAELGARGWSYNDIFRYFLKLEDNRTPEFLFNGYHTYGGPISVEQPRYNPELKQAAAKAAIELGYQFVDPNGERQTGFYDMQSNLRDNQRCSPVKGYLVPVDYKSNLDISVNSFVTRVIIENERATGVELFDGKYRRVKARKEVIITAGSVNTPKILMLSGVGPKDELKKFNIPVVADLPVGKNFHDQSGTYYYFTMDHKFRAINEKISEAASIREYIANRSGPLSSTGNVLVAFLHGLNATVPFDFPNYEIYISELDSSMPKKSGLKSEVYEQLFGPYKNRAIFACLVQNLHPRSRGTVTLNSTIPFDPPLIDPNYFEDSRDFVDFVDGLKFCKKILVTKQLLRLGVKPFQTLMPGCEIYAGNDDEYFKCYAATMIYSFNHPVGTAKMGHPSDPTSVLDPELRVKGVKGLRVADASVMPQVTSSNTHIPVVMIAEKASDMIKDSIVCL